VRLNASFWFGLSSVLTLSKPYQDMVKSKNCDQAKAIAERLAGLKIPFVFATGYGEQFPVPAAFADAPKIVKPYNVDTLRAVLGLAEF